MISKKGVFGEGILMIYRLVLIALIAMIVLGTAAVYYDYYIDIRDVEAAVLAKQSINCLAPEGVLDLSRFEGKEGNFLEVCGIGGDLDRIYARARVREGSSTSDLKVYEFWDSGMEWIRSIYTSDVATKYKLGSFGDVGGVRSFKTRILNNGVESDGVIIMEVFIGHEF
jgi:hypothetical protein